MNKDTTQLVTIELVIGKMPTFVNSSEVRLTPPPAALALMEAAKKIKAVRGVLNLKKRFTISFG